MFKEDPGPCPICGADHVACTAGEKNAQVRTVMLPNRDAAVTATLPLVAEIVQETLPPGQVTTGTYRGTKKR